MAVADRALWIIERNLARSLSLEEIASACGVSRSHLAYAFGTSTGLPVMKYLRGRRLSEAARALVRGAPDILSVALDTGYGSHEAFTRAFKEQFASTPEAIRERGSLEGVALVDPLAWKAADATVRTPHIEKAEALTIVGLSELCSFDSVTRIPGLWQRFMSQYYAAIPAKAADIPVGLSYAVGDEGGFEYVCGVEVTRTNGTRPKDLMTCELPARSYAVFEHRDHISRLTETYRKIWNDALPAIGRVVADAPILERFNQGFDTRTGEGGVQLWIPLES